MTTRSRAYWTCQSAGWSAHLFISLGFASMSGRPPWPLLLAYVWAEAVAAVSSHVLRAWIHRHRWLDLPLPRLLPRILLGSLACGAGITAITSVTSVLFHFNRDPDWNWIYVIPIVVIWSVVLLLWETFYFAFHYFQRYQDARLEQLRLAIAAKDAELRALLAQVNPHFIFNCLNSLRALTMEDPPRATEMIDQLSSVLRYSLQSGRLETVALEREVEAIRAYLKLESMRFEERLSVNIDIDPLSLPVPIPPMLLQMLVENGVKHGISHLAQGGEISVTSLVEGGALKIQVTNSGRLTPHPGGSTEIGLNNARQRLRILYGSAASLVLRECGAGKVLAEVLLPLHPAPA